MLAICAQWAVRELPAQLPAPGGGNGGGERDRVSALVASGEAALAAEDPVRSWRTFQAVLLQAPDRQDGMVGLGRAHLLLGRAATAIAYAEVALLQDAARQDAMTLCVRARIRAREFDGAVRTAESFLGRVPLPDAELLAALASALFRVQRTEDAAQVYQRVLAADPVHAEAHLRLGSGLTSPCEAKVGDDVRSAVASMHDGRWAAAIATLRAALQEDAANPIVHRLLGEALLQERGLHSMAARDPAFLRLQEALPRPDVGALPIGEFVPGYAQLDGVRRQVVDRAVRLFGSRLARLIAIGGRHDLLLETERTTEAASRSMLRGRRTFDGRVWDDVRGIGGLCAATGIEALDEAAQFGFDTLAHELAHQVHYFALQPVDRARIHALYVAAKQNGRCLDYYAATNEAEYFGQGVEAFASLGKRPGGETTHGHTRFELWRVDRELHDFVAGLVDQDPLAGPQRCELLRAAIDVALRCGRPEDGAAAAAMLPPGEERQRAIELTERELAVARPL